MATIICDISALQFYRTPLWVIGGPTLDTAAHPMQTNIFPATFRKNTSQCVVALSHHLYSTVAGISPPFHIIDTDRQFIRGDSIVCHNVRVPASREIIPLGEGLYVTTPERTILDLACKYGDIAAAKIMCEFCGIYTMVNMTDRLRDALERIEQPRYSGRRAGVTAFYRQNGSTESFGDLESQAARWEPCIKRNNTQSSLWKRPPICTLDELGAYANNLDGAYGIKAYRRALRFAFPGSGSPAETLAGRLMGPARGLGQEGLPPFLMNRRIYLNELNHLALGQRSCVVDISWPNGANIRKGCCVEIDGAAFHDDSLIDTTKLRDINTDSARRAALAHMGIEVVSLAWSQLADLEKWDIAMDLIYEKLGIARPLPSAAFLKKRNKLREDVFAPDPTYVKGKRAQK